MRRRAKLLRHEAATSGGHCASQSGGDTWLWPLNERGPYQCQWDVAAHMHLHRCQLAPSANAQRVGTGPTVVARGRSGTELRSTEVQVRKVQDRWRRKGHCRSHAARVYKVEEKGASHHDTYNVGQIAYCTSSRLPSGRGKQRKEQGRSKKE
jgi:hypothetical protein